MYQQALNNNNNEISLVYMIDTFDFYDRWTENYQSITAKCIEPSNR